MHEFIKDLPDGRYTIMLKVTTEEGVAYRDMALVIVDNEESTYYVDDDYDSSTPGWQSDHFSNIQDAIDASGNNDKIYVRCGEYHKSLIMH